MANIVNNLVTKFSTPGAPQAQKTIERTNKLLGQVGQTTKKTSEDSVTLTRSTTRLGQASASAGRQFGAQASGLGGLVSAYAGAAATVFALQQAFSALNRAAQAETIIRGTQNLASAIGESGNRIIGSLQEITQGQLTMVEAAEKANLALASGFNTKQIEQLGEVSLKASKALGRNLGDAFERLVRGAAKLEPELLDELGIFTRIEPAAAAYAKQLGKTASELTQFERRQAFVNEVIDEGLRKFSAIDVTAPSAQKSLERLATAVSDLGQKFGLMIANSVLPLVNFFANDMTNAISLFSLALFQVSRVAFREFNESIGKVSGGMERFRTFILDNSRAAEKGTKALEDMNSELANVEKTSYRGSAAQRAAATEFTRLGKAGLLTQGNLDDYIKTQKEQILLAKQRNVEARATLKSLNTEGVATAATQKRIAALNATIQATSNDQGRLQARIDLATAAMSRQSVVAKTFKLAIGAATVAVRGLAFAARAAATALNAIFLVVAIIPLLKQLPVVGDLIEASWAKVLKTFKDLTQSSKDLTLGLRGLVTSSSAIDLVTEKYVKLGLSQDQVSKGQENFIKTLEELKPDNLALAELSGQLGIFSETAEGGRQSAKYLGVALGVAVGATSLLVAGVGAAALAIGGFTLAVDALLGFGLNEWFFNLTAGLFGFGKAIDPQIIALNGVAEAISDLDKEIADADNFADRMELSYQRELLQQFEISLQSATYAQLQFSGEISRLTGLNADVVVEKLNGSFDRFGSTVDGVQIGIRGTNKELRALQGNAGELAKTYLGFSTVLDTAASGMYDVNIPLRQNVKETQALVNAEANLRNALSQVEAQLESLNAQVKEVQQLERESSGEARVNARKRIETLKQERRFLKQNEEAILAVLAQQEVEINTLKRLGSEIDTNETKFDKFLKTYSNAIKQTSDLELTGIFDGATFALDGFEKSLIRVNQLVRFFGEGNDLIAARAKFSSDGFDLGETEKLADFVTRFDTDKLQNQLNLTTQELGVLSLELKEAADLEDKLNQVLSATTSEFYKQIPAIDKLVKSSEKYVNALVNESNVIDRKQAISEAKEILKLEQARFKFGQDAIALERQIAQVRVDTAKQSSSAMQKQLEHQKSINAAAIESINLAKEQNLIALEADMIATKARQASFEKVTEGVDFTFGISEDASDILKQMINRNFEIELRNKELEKLNIEIGNLEDLERINESNFQKEKQLMNVRQQQATADLEREKQLAIQAIEDREKSIKQQQRVLQRQEEIRKLELSSNKANIDEQFRLRKIDAQITKAQLDNTLELAGSYLNFIDGIAKINNSYLTEQQKIFASLLEGMAEIATAITGDTVEVAGQTPVQNISVGQSDLKTIILDVERLSDQFDKISKDGGALDGLATKQKNNLDSIGRLQEDLYNESKLSLENQLSGLNTLKNETTSYYAQSETTLEALQTQEALLANLQRERARADYTNQLLELENAKKTLEFAKQLDDLLQSKDFLSFASTLSGGLKSLVYGNYEEEIEAAAEAQKSLMSEYNQALENFNSVREQEIESLQTLKDLVLERKEIELEAAGIAAKGINGARKYFELQEAFISNVTQSYDNAQVLQGLKQSRMSAELELIEANNKLTDAINNLSNLISKQEKAENSFLGKIVDGFDTISRIFNSTNEVLNGFDQLFSAGTAGGDTGDAIKTGNLVVDGVTKLGTFFEGTKFGDKLAPVIEGFTAASQNYAKILESSSNVVVGHLDAAIQTASSGISGTLTVVGKVLGQVGNFLTGAEFAQKYFPDAKERETFLMGGIGGVAGGIAGAAIGSQVFAAMGTAIAGPMGAAIGAVLGGLGGGFLSKAFFGKQSNKTGTGTLDFGSGVITEGGQTGKKFSQANRDAAMSIARYAKDLTTTLESITGGTQQLKTFQAEIGSRDPSNIIADGTRYGIDAQSPESVEKTVFEILVNGLKNTVEDGDMKDAIANLDFGRSVIRNLENLSFAKNFRNIIGEISGFVDNIITVEEQVSTIKDKVAETAATLAEGILSELEELQDRTKEVFGDNSRQLKDLRDSAKNLLLQHIELNVAQDGTVRLMKREAETIGTMALAFAATEAEIMGFKDALTDFTGSAEESERILREGLNLKLRELADEFAGAINIASLALNGLDVEAYNNFSEILAYQDALIQDANAVEGRLDGYTGLLLQTEEVIFGQRMEMVSTAKDEELKALRELTKAGGEFSNAFVKAAVDAEIASRKINSIFESNQNLRQAERGSLNLRRGFASGGLVSGGERDKDSVPAMLMPGEFVMNKKASENIGYDILSKMNEGNIVKYNNGGIVRLGGSQTAGVSDSRAQATVPTNFQFDLLGSIAAIPPLLYDSFANYGADVDLTLSFQEAAAIVTDANADLFATYKNLISSATSTFDSSFGLVLNKLQEGEVIMARAIFEMSTGMRTASDNLDAYNQVIAESRTNQLLNTAGIIKGVDEVSALTQTLDEFYYATQRSETEYVDLYKVTNELTKLLAQEVITSEEYATALNSVNSAYDTSIQAIQQYTQFFVSLKDELDDTGAQSSIRNLVYSFEDSMATISQAVEDGMIDVSRSVLEQTNLISLYNADRIALVKGFNEEQLKATRDSQDAIVDITYKTAAAAELMARQLQAASSSFGSFESELVDFYNSILPAGESLYNGLKRSLESILNEAGIVFSEVSTDFVGTIGTFTTLAQNGKAGILNLEEAIGQLNYQLTESESIDIETYQTGISLLSSSFNSFINEFQELRNALDVAKDDMENFRASLLDSTKSIANDVKTLFSQMVSDYRSGLQNLQNMYTQALQGQASAEEALYNTLFSAQQAFATAGGDLQGHISIIKGIIEGPDGYAGLTTYLESLRLDIENGVASIGQIDTASSVQELQERLQDRLDRLTALQALPDSADKFVRMSRILSEVADIESQLNSATNASDALKNAALDLVDVELELNKNNLDAKYTDVNLTLTEMATNLVTQAETARQMFNEANDVVAGITQALADADTDGFQMILEGLNTSSDTVAQFTSQLDALQNEFNDIQIAAQLLKDSGFADVLNDFINVADPNRITSLTQAAGDAFVELQTRISDYQEVIDAKNAYEALYGSIGTTSKVLPIDEFNMLNSELAGLEAKLNSFLPTIGATSLDDVDSAFKQFIRDAIALLESPIQLDVSAMVSAATLNNSTLTGTQSNTSTLIATQGSLTNTLLQSILTQGLGAQSPGWLYYILLVLEDMRGLTNDQNVLLGGVAKTFTATEPVSISTVPSTDNTVGGSMFSGGLTGQIFDIATPITKPADYFYIVTPRVITAQEIFQFTPIRVDDVIDFIPTIKHGLDEPGQPGLVKLLKTLADYNTFFNLVTRTTTFNEWLFISIISTTLNDWVSIIKQDHDWATWWNPITLQDHSWSNWWNPAILQDHSWSNWWNSATLQDHSWLNWWNAPQLEDMTWALWWNTPMLQEHAWYDWWYNPSPQNHAWYDWWNPAELFDHDVYDWFHKPTLVNVTAFDFFDPAVKIRLADFVDPEPMDYMDWFDLKLIEANYLTFFEPITKLSFGYLDWFTIPEKVDYKFSDWVNPVSQDIEVDLTDKVIINPLDYFADDLFTIVSQTLPAASFYDVQAQSVAAGNIFTFNAAADKIHLGLEEVFVLDPPFKSTHYLNLDDIFTNYDGGFTFAKYQLALYDIIENFDGEKLYMDDAFSLTLDSLFTNYDTGQKRFTFERENLTFDDLFDTIVPKNFDVDEVFGLETGTNQELLRPFDLFTLSTKVEDRIKVSGGQIYQLTEASNIQASQLFNPVNPLEYDWSEIIDTTHLYRNPYLAVANQVFSLTGTLSKKAEDIITVTGQYTIDLNNSLTLEKITKTGDQFFTPEAKAMAGNRFFTPTQSSIAASSLFKLNQDSQIGVSAYDLFKITEKVDLDVSASFQTDLKYIGDKLSNVAAQINAMNNVLSNYSRQIRDNIELIAEDIFDTFFNDYQNQFLKNYYDTFQARLGEIAYDVRTKIAPDLSQIEENTLLSLNLLGVHQPRQTIALENISSKVNSYFPYFVHIENTLNAIQTLLTTTNTLISSLISHTVTIKGYTNVIKNNTTTMVSLLTTIDQDTSYMRPDIDSVRQHTDQTQQVLSYELPRTNTFLSTISNFVTTYLPYLRTIDQDTSYMRPDIDSIRIHTGEIDKNTDFLQTLSDTAMRLEGQLASALSYLLNIQSNTYNTVQVSKYRYVYDAYRTLSVPGFSEGGAVSGSGTGTSDSIAAMLSNGEYVIRANSAKRLGKDTLDMLNTTGSVKSLGRNGDSELAHINKQEAGLLKMFGGSGTTNPLSGLKEFFFDGAGHKNRIQGTLAEMASSITRSLQSNWGKGDGYPEWMTSRGENSAVYSNNLGAKRAFSEAVRYANLLKYGSNEYNLRGRNWVLDWDHWANSVNTWSSPWGSRRFYYNDSNALLNSVVNSFANGGMVSGPGTGVSDSIPAMLSDGEYVIRKSSVDKVGRNALDYMNSTGNVPGNVEINITNNGKPVDVDGEPTLTTRDGKVVVDVVLKDLRTNGPIAKSVKRMR